jgi:hypothetical protein
MSRMPIAGAALLAAFVISGLASSGAYAAQWLIRGKTIESAKPAVMEGKFLFLILLSGGLSRHYLCSVKLPATIEPGGLGKIEKIEDLSEKTPLVCELLGGSTCTFKALHLPWKISLSENVGEFILHVQNSGAGSPELEICSGEPTKLVCTYELATDALVNLVSGGVEWKILNQLGSCGPGATMHIYGEGQITSSERILSVSK